MAIAFFVTKQGEFYACLDPSYVTQENFDWLSRKRIDSGRESSFEIAKKSPEFSNCDEAEKWLRTNWFSEVPQFLDDDQAPIDPDRGPTQEDYKMCAMDANDIMEPAGMGRLEKLLPLENNHSYLCSIGVWYWQLGFFSMAEMAYRRSLEIEIEPPTLFNLAICQDDAGIQTEAKTSIRRFYSIVSSEEEILEAENMLLQNGKKHLLRGNLES